VSGLESASFGLAGKAGVEMLKKWARSTDFERLCEALADRFEEGASFSAATFAHWGNDEAFMTALDSFLLPPHEFDRGALIKAITPLVGPLDEDSTAEDFAAEIADAIYAEMREAKEGDALVRFEIDRVIHATAAPEGRLSTDWAPKRARRHLGELIEQDPRAAGLLQRALSGRDDLPAELELLVRRPQPWLKEGGAELWRTVAHLAEIVGCWSTARQAWRTYEERPGADRVRGFFGAADAAENAGNVDEAETLRAQAKEFDPEHELVQLLDVLRCADAGERLRALEALPPARNEERAARRKAFMAMALVDLGRDADSADLAEQAFETLPDLRAREAIAASIVSANQKRWEAGHSVDRSALRTAVDHYREILEALRESRRHQEAGGVLGRLVYCELLAGRFEAAAMLLSEVPEEELVGEVPVELAGLALAAGDPQRVEILMKAYEGDSAAGSLLRIRVQLRDPVTRADGVAALDRGVADQDFEFSVMRLMAALPSTGEVPWSDKAEELLRKEKPVMASQLKAEWYERRDEPDAARRELAKHAREPRALRALMMIYANDQRWDKAVPHALALLDLDPDLADRVAAGQILKHAGQTDRAEMALRKVFEHPEADVEERSAAFDELADIFMRGRRFEEARRLAVDAENAGIPSASWLAAHSLARLGETQEAFEVADQLTPRNELDRMLLSDLIFAHEAPRRALERLIEIADELPVPNESLEGQIVMALLRCEHDDLEMKLIERAGPQQFVERFPESELLWKESIPKEEDELLERLRELTEGRAKAVSLAEKHIFEDGDWPVGTLATAIGKGLAETWAALGSLPISYRAEQLRHVEVEAAQNAAGGPLLLDTAALCMLELLPDDVLNAILTEFPHSEKTASTGDDLLKATLDPRPANDSEPATSLGWDLAESRPVLQEISPDEANLPRERARRMLDLGRRFKTAAEQREDDSDDLADSRVTAIYKDIFAVARYSKRCVYADDRFLRRVLAAEGVETFGTVTLLDVLADSGAISSDDRERGLAVMRERHAVDLLSEA
jgi:tetratricopeptide (TPR) repeat protein